MCFFQGSFSCIVTAVSARRGTGGNLPHVTVARIIVNAMIQIALIRDITL
jgi:hypothetical protein